MTAELSPDEIRAALYGLGEFRDRRAIMGRPVPPSITALLSRLETIHRCPMADVMADVSRTRHVSPGDATNSGEWIGTKEAARMLGWHPRKVQRHAADLDGKHLGGRLWFQTRTVREYMKDAERQQK
ncbi:hypothetical protein MB901379_00487 [Mycobacterium basiliense]|uniref:Uncharacterized protein n=1 Tax=Mycobacterium basiliense TaxID=2094119 RepID=A0A447G8X2_9MYCO|nr:hypothetical protein [Mycobacterium basiliense]VDM86958.1 hypothetical protein MB901379_00487 [Mycobacterium basiliense]